MKKLLIATLIVLSTTNVTAQNELTKDQLAICEWVGVNSATAMRHNINGYDKDRVKMNFKRKTKDTLPKGFDLTVINPLIDVIVDWAYAEKYPRHLITEVSEDYGKHMYNRCVNNRLVKFK